MHPSNQCESDRHVTTTTSPTAIVRWLSFSAANACITCIHKQSVNAISMKIKLWWDSITHPRSIHPTIPERRIIVLIVCTRPGQERRADVDRLRDHFYLQSEEISQSTSWTLPHPAP